MAISLERRNRHTYVAGWSYLDPHQYIGSLDIRCRETEVDEEDDCEATKTTMIVRVELEEPQPLSLICEAIRDTLGGSSCQHEHDCCGCWNTYVSEVRHVFNNRYFVETHSSRNY
jgi:hypothetical protein